MSQEVQVGRRLKILGFVLNLICFFQMLFWIWPQIPVLSLHQILETPRGLPHLDRSREDLQSLIHQLRKRGCRPFFPGDHYEGDCQVLLSFDDGYDEHFSWVMPWLEKEKWPALFFIPLHMLAEEGSEKGLLQKKSLGYHYVGAHGLDERSIPELMKDLGHDGLGRALGEMRQTLQKRFERKVDWLALPKGEMEKSAKSLIRKHFLYYFGVDGGRMNPLLKRGFQDRLMLQPDTTREEIFTYIDRSNPLKRREVWLLTAFWMLFNLFLLFRTKQLDRAKNRHKNKEIGKIRS